MKFEFESDLHGIALSVSFFFVESLFGLLTITLKAAGGGSSSAHLTATVLRKESLYSLGPLICRLTDLLLVGGRGMLHKEDHLEAFSGMT